MPNEPLPHQLTVKQLKLVLEDAQENAVVALRLPAGYITRPELGVMLNLQVEDKGPVVIFTLQEAMY